MKSTKKIKPETPCIISNIVWATKSSNEIKERKEEAHKNKVLHTKPKKLIKYRGWSSSVDESAVLF